MTPSLNNQFLVAIWRIFLSKKENLWQIFPKFSENSVAFWQFFCPKHNNKLHWMSTEYVKSYSCSHGIWLWSNYMGCTYLHIPQTWMSQSWLFEWCTGDDKLVSNSMYAINLQNWTNVNCDSFNGFILFALNVSTIQLIEKIKAFDVSIAWTFNFSWTFNGLGCNHFFGAKFHNGVKFCKFCVTNSMNFFFKLPNM